MQGRRALGSRKKDDPLFEALRLVLVDGASHAPNVWQELAHPSVLTVCATLEPALKSHARRKIAELITAMPPSRYRSARVVEYLLEVLEGFRDRERRVVARRLEALSCHLHLASMERQRVGIRVAAAYVSGDSKGMAIGALRVVAAAEAIPDEAECALVEALGLAKSSEAVSWAQFFLMSGPYLGSVTVELARRLENGGDALLAEYAREKLLCVQDGVG